MTIAVDWDVKNQTKPSEICHYILKKLKACYLAVLLGLFFFLPNKGVQMKILLFFDQNICCGYTKEMYQ